MSNAEPEVIGSSSQSSQDDDVHYRDMRSYLDDESGMAYRFYFFIVVSSSLLCD